MQKSPRGETSQESLYEEFDAPFRMIILRHNSAFTGVPVPDLEAGEVHVHRNIVEATQIIPRRQVMSQLTGFRVTGPHGGLCNDIVNLADGKVLITMRSGKVFGPQI